MTKGEVYQSHDVSEEGVEGTFADRNPDNEDWLQRVEKENELLHRSECTLHTKKRNPPLKMADISLNVNEEPEYAKIGEEVEYSNLSADGGEDEYAEVGGIDNLTFSMESEGKEALPDLDVNENYSTIQDVPEPEVRYRGRHDEFPGPDFFGEKLDLKEWMDSIKSEPKDKVNHCVVKSSLPPAFVKNADSGPLIEIQDPVFSQNEYKVKPEAGTFSYMNVEALHRVPMQGQKVEAAPLTPRQVLSGDCFRNRKEANRCFWYFLLAFFIVAIIVIVIVFATRGGGGEG